MNRLVPAFFALLFFVFAATPAARAQHDGEAPEHGTEAPAGEEFNVGEVALHHIANANAVHIFGDWYLHLPAILYAPGHGWSAFLTSKFDAHHHGNGTKAIDHYVLMHGSILRIKDPSFPYGEVPVSDYAVEEVEKDGKKRDVYYAIVDGKRYELDKKTTWDAGILGGGVTSFYDFSISKNVFTLFLTLLLLFFLFRRAVKTAEANSGKAPSGVQSLLEPLIEFVRDEVAIPSIGKDKYEPYLPFLLSLFFFILGLNLIGQFPIMGNVTGNLSFTLVLALITALYYNLKGNKHYWEHIFWMPNVPTPLRLLILTPVEALGILIKPFTLMLRLFANITAGHLVIVSFVGLIFIFGKSGASLGGSVVGIIVSLILTMVMMIIEVLVAFVQAYVFTLLAASYFGMATEEAHH